MLTVLWFFPVAFLASLLSICNIEQVAPSLAESLQRHDITRALVRTGLPTLVVSLLNLLVPYLYDYLSNVQGFLSQGDVELSAISKNFFFVFFNIFVVYAVSGSAALADFWQIIRDSLSDTNTIAAKIAQSIQSLSNFYLNFIMLQAFGLFPFKLLQFGSIALYPFYRMGAKTPRDFAQLVQPDLFNYGFFLPTALLVFILCLVYSVLPRAQLVLLLGVCYFGVGYFVHKYQLLYSMEQPQHATGGAWPLICRRIVVGLISFQVVMLAILVLRKAFVQATLIVPLMALTLWYPYFFDLQFIPLTKFIALRSIKRSSDPGSQSNPSANEAEPTRLTRRLSTIDEGKEKGVSFINPSLVVPLEQPWIYKDPPPPLSPAETASDFDPVRYESNEFRIPQGQAVSASSTSSSFSLGDTHVWRENGDTNV
jgi:calcium permeable stress-gated cation channel